MASVLENEMFGTKRQQGHTYVNKTEKKYQTKILCGSKLVFTCACVHVHVRVYVCVCVCVHACTDTCRIQKRKSDHIEPGL